LKFFSPFGRSLVLCGNDDDGGEETDDSNTTITTRGGSDLKNIIPFLFFLICISA